MRKVGIAHQIQDGNLHHTLVEVGGTVLDDLDGNNLLCLEVLALDDLSKGTLAQHIENEVSVPTNELAQASPVCNGGNRILMTSLLRTQNIVNIEDIIAVLIIIAVVLNTLARLG